MDMVDSPGYGPKYMKPKKSSNFQTELQQRLHERRKQGLTADLTDDSDVPEDLEPGGDDDYDPYAQYRTDFQQKKGNRPSSAKRRSPLEHQADLSLTDTLRPGAGDRFMKKGGSSAGNSSMPPLSSPKTPPRDRYSMEMPSLTSPKLSPKGSSSMRPYGDNKGGLSPKGDKSNSKLKQEQPMSASDMIFGRKTPTSDLQGRLTQDSNKPWQAPNLRKASPVMMDDDRGSGDRGVSPTSGLRGRTTPSLESSLRPISETPSPRPRQLSGGTTLPRATKGTEGEVPRPRPRNTTDIFGKTSTVEVELSDDEDTQRQQRFSKLSPGRKTPTDLYGGRKTPTGGQRMPGLSGRQTPTDPMGRKTPTRDLQGRKTPTNDPQGRKTPTGVFQGRKTPTKDMLGRKSPTGSAISQGQRARFSKQGDREEPPPLKKEASLLDFLNEDSPDPRKKKQDTKPRLLRDVSNDSIDDEFEQANKFLTKKQQQQQKTVEKRPLKSKQDVMPKGKSSEDLWSSRNIDEKIPMDQSSVCADVENDPNMRMTATQGESRMVNGSKSGKMTNGQVNNEIIDMVAEEQEKHGPGHIKPIQPDKEKSKIDDGKRQVHKPKPRHSLPGTPSSIGNLTEDSLNSTRSIRDAIYTEWRKEKMKSAKQQLAEKKKKEEETTKQKEEEKQEKFLENKASYNAWMEKKKETTLRDQAREKKKEEEKKIREEREKEQKRKEAAKNFEIWKETKTELMKEKIRDKKMTEYEEKKEKDSAKKAREKLSTSAFKGWKSKKDNLIKDQVKTKKTMTKQQVKMQEKQKHQQEEDALRQYHDWLERKDAQKKQERKQRRYGSTEDLEDRPAWSPANRTIPFGR
ncbi:histone-lysine N-methyltransferase, H3 lysine-79 specific-like [Ylistrum balloti]|uniref:histone-lysine N-methyltransferase, H3 lysine-79 specific-like n=1 Tax=Ylistrum balloti TaxID=509963 RepID=UPI002905F04B|nr:histone-lysine N-methyltransferase, H3 lysine-79 specific-like [Ylistrum balloti]